MPLLTLLLFGLWALVCVRLICFRGTLSSRTVATYLVLGAVMGPVAVSIAEKFFNEYSWTGGPGYFILINAAKQFMLLIPVFWLLSRPAWRDSSSVADAFLAAFAIGFGYDLASSIISSAPSQNIAGFSFLPPGSYSASAANVAGYGWWLGTVALVFVATGRLLRKNWFSYLIGGLVLLLCAIDQTLATVYSSDVPKWWDLITFHRNAGPYVCLACLVICVVLESSRIRRGEGQGSLLSEYQALLTHYIGFRFQEARRAGNQSRIGRQLDIVQTEMKGRPSDAGLTALAANLEEQRKIAQQPMEAAAPFNVKSLLRRRVPHLGFLLLAFLLVIVLSLPVMQPFGNGVWQWFLFSDKFAPFQLNIVATALLAWMAWSYLTSPPGTYRGVRADETSQFYAEHGIVLTGMAVFLIASIYEVPVAPPAYPYSLPSPIEFVSFSTPFTVAAGLASNVSSDPQQANHWITVLLLMLCAATGLTARRWDLWRSAPQPARLRISVRHLLVALRIGIVAWLSLVLFTYLQILAHLWFAKAVAHAWDPAKHSILGIDIRNWNSVLGLVSALVTAPCTFAFIWLARWVAQHIQNFLFSEPSAVKTQESAKTASTTGVS